MRRTLRLGTRGSELALTQSRWVAAHLERIHRTPVALEVIRTRGDEVIDRPLPEIGGKGVFTEALDRALLDGRIDLAVHSLKDLPTEPVEGLRLGCVPEREDSRDVLVGRPGGPSTLAALPPGARVGTSALRRRALLAAFRPDVTVLDVRGNLDTRLRKLDEGGYDALVLAAAGLRRLGLEGRIGEALERTAWLPAPGQGALGVVVRDDDPETLELLTHLHHAPTAAAVTAERALLASLGGGCQMPLGALAIPYEQGLRLWGLLVSPDGRQAVRADLTGTASHPAELGERLADALLARGAREVLELLGGETAPAPPPP